MKRDFTHTMFDRLLKAFQVHDYQVQTFCDFIESPGSRVVILRHDVDLRPENALVTAQIEKNQGIRASYYFRIVDKSYDEAIIKEIAGMGHEVGYHYEDLALAGGDVQKALDGFGKNLDQFRKIYPVKTVCMHGSPLSKWDNRKLWETYDYRDFGVVGEPYFDVDFTRVLYLTDTGRRWDWRTISVRDRVASNLNRAIGIRTTFDLIGALKDQRLPHQIMINIHPQRWHNAFWPWGKELVFQETKNILKKIIVMRNEKLQAHK